MKKIMQSLLALTMAAAMAVSFAACGEKKETPEKGPISADVSVSSSKADAPAGNTDPNGTVIEAQSSAASSEAPAKKPAPVPDKKPGFSNVEEYLASGAMEEVIATLKDNLKDAPLDVELTAEGNKLIYTYTYNMDLPAGVADQLTTALNGQAEVFRSLSKTIADATGMEPPVVVVRYLDKNKNEICSVEFSAK